DSARASGNGCRGGATDCVDLFAGRFVYDGAVHQLRRRRGDVVARLNSQASESEGVKNWLPGGPADETLCTTLACGPRVCKTGWGRRFRLPGQFFTPF